MTMRHLKKYLSALFLGVLLTAVSVAQDAPASTSVPAASVYDEVSDALGKFKHRVPGTPEYYQSADVLEKILKGRGIDVKRQVFPTYVPEITKKDFKVDGKDVEIFALSPNNLALPTTGPAAVEGELIYLPKEELGKSYGDITNKIVLLEWGENDYPKTLFTEGAKAIIFVGNENATQWDIAKLKSQYSIMYPYFYMERAEAEKNGLLEKGANGRMAKMEVNSRWKEVDGINLWFEIKPETFGNFELDQPEAILLGARLDTFGTVPGLVGGERELANMALLAETAAKLNGDKSKLPRSVFVVFYGASYNAYDSLRHFLFPVSRRSAKSPNDIQSYLKGYEQELKDTNIYLDVLEKNPVVLNEDRTQYKVRLLLRDVVIKDYNRINYVLTDINTKLRNISTAVSKIDKLIAGEKVSDSEEFNKLSKAELEETKAKLLASEPALKAERDKLKTEDIIMVSNLRKALNDRVVPEDLKERLKGYITEVRNSLEMRKLELEKSIAMSKDWLVISEATGNVDYKFANGTIKNLPYEFVGAYFFDFAAPDQPFIFTARSYEMPHLNGEMFISYYTQYFSVLSDLLNKSSIQKSKSPVLEDSLTTKNSFEGLTSRSLIYLPHTPALSLKIPSFTFRNVPGNYDYDEMPSAKEFDLRGLLPVAVELVDILATSPELSLYTKVKDSNLTDDTLNYSYIDGSYKGSRFTYLAPDGKEIDGPATSTFTEEGMKYPAFAYTRPYDYPRARPVSGFSLSPFAAINQSGYTTIPLTTLDGSWGAGVDLNAMRVGAMKFDSTGNVSHINSSNAADYNKLFACIGGAHVYDFAPLTTNFASFLHVVNGITDGSFKNSNGYHRIATGDGVIYVDRPQKAKIYWDDETFILGSTEENPIGKGIDIDAQSILNLNVPRIAFDNTIQLNLQRINALHKRNIFNSVIEGYHDKAEQHLIEANAEREAGNINKARAHELFGQTLAIRAYRPLKQTINDLVRSVLILLILTIPFSFALERLIIGATNVYKQLGWILTFFVMTFVLLYFTHPAFALSEAPMIIFIAFFIIVMSVIVIYIVMNRFKSELMAMQGFDTSAHRVNSENSMLLAAILIGVSSMRNRPVKTFLTILTVIFLTFTIISFASFDSTGYVRPTYIGDGSGEVRIEAFLANHLDLLDASAHAIRERFGDNYDIYRRSASYYSPFYVQTKTGPIQENILFNPANSKTLVMEDIVGFEPGESSRSAKLERLMPKLGKSVEGADGDIPGVYLSSNASKDLGIEVGEYFYLRNMKVRLDGIFSALDLDSFTYLDDGKVVPPNYKETMKAEERNIWAIMNDAMEDASNFIWSNPDYTVLTDFDTACKLNSFSNAIVMYPKDGRNPEIINDATDIAEVWFGIVYSNTANGVHRHYFTQGYEASGLGTILVPLMLGALIILSSLLGSIADREREIFTFSALGLSPKDVSVLFFAESGVYAVIGGLGGYLLSQLTTSVLNYLSSLGLIQAPEMNYSSMTTVYTILIVMAIVMLSTIYPAIKAARSASPDIARKWKMPPPVGNKLSFQFPFTVSRIDFGGILVFISEHFANHADSSLGSFAASNVVITYGESEYTDNYMLSAELTLAPFDLGVAEEFHMYSASSDIEGIDVVTVTIVRKDGSQGAWLRGNQRFVDEIRNQFLLWRSLPVETVLHYRGLADAKQLNKE